jgi:6-phosphogluconolactonase
MTLSYPMLNRARRVLWLATGAEKHDMLLRLRAADHSIPAGLVESARALLLADRAALSQD